ncbi:MAG: ubiquinol oxidase subunit II [Paenibacillaceae bacterium]|nr:ubiquinol oxidase subunit II [Paenibacillaceae bacterium]
MVLLAATGLLSGCSGSGDWSDWGSWLVLDPKGPIGGAQRDLIVISTLLCSVVIVPVLILTAIIVWRYRERKNSTAAYQPTWEHNTRLEVIWWSIPIVVIATLAVITFHYTYKIEPSKPLEAAGKKAVTIQVVSLDWKWLFLYPEQGIASVNYVRFPEDTPVRFELTSDAPMNSFWIPQLGGQIYTMSGMAMKLYLQADEPGVYFGSGANFSGREFASMRFDAEATSQGDFDKWVQQVKGGSKALTTDDYAKLAEQGIGHRQLFSALPDGLFDSIVNKYASSHHHQAAEAKADKGDKAKPDATKKDTMPGMDHSQHSMTK